MKKLTLVAISFLLLFSLSALPAEAKHQKRTKPLKNKIINCGVKQSTASKLFIGSGTCYIA